MVSIRGSGRVVRVDGVLIESQKNTSEKLRLLLKWLSRRRLVRLISRLWAIELIHFILFFDSQVSSINIAGLIIFSIAVD